MRKKQPNWLHNVIILLEGLVIFTILFLGTTIYANWDAVKNEIGFLTQAQGTPIEIATSQPTPSPTLPVVPIDEPAHIVIEKIGVDAPIQWDIPVEATVPALSSGIAHMKGTARLGEIGNLFLTGHSSDYAWKKNPYAAVFSLLPKLELGDTITIRENGKAYIYQVAQTKIVNPDQVEVASPTSTPIVTLMTCYPIGTTRQRYIVHASLVASPEAPLPSGGASGFTIPEIKFR